MSEDALLFVSSELFLSGQNCELSVFCVVSGRPRLLAACVLSADLLAGLCGFSFFPSKTDSAGRKKRWLIQGHFWGGKYQLENRKN